jgi:hypothetical protein
MKAGRNEILATVVACALTVTTTAPASAQSSTPIGGVTKSDVVWIGVAVAAIGAGVGVGIYYAVHHNHSLTGCAVSGANGLELQNKGDQQTYALVGAVTAIKPGDRVRVSGKRVKKSAGPAPQFLVEQLSKDYGSCPGKPATP